MGGANFAASLQPSNAVGAPCASRGHSNRSSITKIELSFVSNWLLSPIGTTITILLQNAHGNRAKVAANRCVDGSCCLRGRHIKATAVLGLQAQIRGHDQIYSLLGAEIEHPSHGCEDRSIARALAATYDTATPRLSSAPGWR